MQNRGTQGTVNAKKGKGTATKKDAKTKPCREEQKSMTKDRTQAV